MRKWIDIPPVWLALFLAVAWWQTEVMSRFTWPAWTDWAGGLLILAGLALMAAAVAEMRRARTTPLPHLAPEALVTSGVFAFSRNPIYLGDALVLAGAGLVIDSWFALAAVPLFARLIARRFIIGEEERLHAAFGRDFERYAAHVRRWV